MENPHLDRIYQELQVVIAEVKATFSMLRYEQFNWRAHPKKWSIAACMQHLLIVNSYYHPQLQKKIIDNPLTVKHYTPYKSSWMGRFFMRFVNPDKFRKTSAPSFLKPAKSSDYPLELRDQYIAYLEGICEFVLKADALDLNRTKINSSLGPIIRFNLGDFFEIESMHNRRHVEQMKRALQEDNFPKN